MNVTLRCEEQTRNQALAKHLFHLICIFLNLNFYLVTGTLGTISIFMFILKLLLSFFNNLVGTGWLQKITGNRRDYFKLLKRAMGIFFFIANSFLLASVSVDCITNP